MDDQDLQKQIETYKELAQTNKNIDVASLMINALQQHQENTLTMKEKTRAYLVSFAVPPFGLIYAVKFFWFSDKSDAKKSAGVCVLLTVISIVMMSLTLKAMLSSSGASLQQIEQIKPQDIYQLSQ